MPANTVPIFGLTPNIGTAVISQTAALTRSDGVGVIGTTLFPCFTAGVNGSFVNKVRFTPEANAPLSTIATVLRVYLSTTTAPGATTTAFQVDTLGELGVPIVAAANATNGANFYDFPMNIAIPSGEYLLVSQHAAQTAGTNWQAMVFGMDY
jgi:hypothetical protein